MEGGFGLVIVGIWLAAVVGWVMNIVYLTQAAAVTPMELLRIAGILVAPLGTVLGWIGMLS